MKEALLLLAAGFEETEATTTHDILTRTGQIEVLTASVTDALEVKSSGGLTYRTDARLKDVDLAHEDFLVLPGGKRGVAGLEASPEAIAAVRYFHDHGKPIYAICAAPSILGNLGYLDGRRYTSFPGFERGKGTPLDEDVVNDGGLITGHAMASALPFAEAIVRQELGEEAVKAIYPGTRGRPWPQK